MPETSIKDQISGWAQIASPIVDAVIQGGQNRKQRKFMREMYNLQRQHALEDWERNYIANSPEWQMRRLKAAGLNPHLVYGNGADAQVGQMPRASSVSTPSVQPTPLRMGETLSQITTNRAIETNTDLTKQKIETEKNNQIIQALDAVGKGLDNNRKYMDNEQFKKLSETYVEIQKQLLKNSVIQGKVQQEENTRQWQLQPEKLQNAKLQNTKLTQDITLELQNYIRQGWSLEKSLEAQSHQISILAKQVYGQELTNREVQERIDNIHQKTTQEAWDNLQKQIKDGEISPLDLLDKIIIPVGGNIFKTKK